MQILKDFVKQNFPASQMLDYALNVEKITTSKVSSKVKGRNRLTWVRRDIIVNLSGGFHQIGQFIVIKDKAGVWASCWAPPGSTVDIRV